MPPSHLRVENRSAVAGPEWDCSMMRPDDTGRVRARRYARPPGLLLFYVQPDLLAKSISRRLAVLARFARADVNALAIVHLDFDRLITAVTADIEAHVVARLL